VTRTPWGCAHGEPNPPAEAPSQIARSFLRQVGLRACGQSIFFFFWPQRVVKRWRNLSWGGGRTRPENAFVNQKESNQFVPNVKLAILRLLRNRRVKRDFPTGASNVSRQVTTDAPIIIVYCLSLRNKRTVVGGNNEVLLHVSLYSVMPCVCVCLCLCVRVS
jgi:hypothetical protein